jgi:hypothetical protein
MDGLWSTCLAVALPLLGVDSGVLRAAGYQERVSGCAMMSLWEWEHPRKVFVQGFSHEVYGELIVLATTEDDALIELVVARGEQRFEGEPLHRRDEQCLVDAEAVTWERNALGVEVETTNCFLGGAVVQRAMHAVTSDGFCAAFASFVPTRSGLHLR